MSTDATVCKVCGGPFAEKRIIIDGKAYHERCSYMSHPSHTWDDYARLSDLCGEYQTALIEISELPGVRADEASDIARRALFKHVSFTNGVRE